MLLRDMMEGSHDRAVKQAPHVLHCVGVDIAPHPLFSTVVDGFMAGVSVTDPPVRGPIIGVDSLSIGVRGGPNEPVQFFASGVLPHLHPHVTARSEEHT